MGGKTYRTKIQHSYLPRSGTIEALDRDVSRFDGVIEAAVTAVDSFFDVDFLVGRGVGSLNSDGRWEEVTAIMEENCVHQERRFNRRELHWETLYRMPIIGHRSFIKCDSELASYGAPQGKPARGWMRGNSRSKYLCWRGELFDTNYVYRFDGSKLKAAFPLTVPLPEFTLSGEIQKLTNFKVRDSRGKRFAARNIDINHTEGARNSSWTATEPGQFIEIDLGTFEYLTHIGTAGEFPKLEVFPRRSIVGRRRMQLASSGYANHVHILSEGEEESTDSWCTEYELQYRHFLTNDWLSVGNFSANWDASTEHVNELFHFFNKPGGLYTRYLRIRPVEANNRASMRFALYGRSDSKSEGEGSSSSSSMRGTCCEAVGSTEVVPQQTIDYVVIEAEQENNHLCLDGQLRFYGVRSWQRRDSSYEIRDRKSRNKSKSDVIAEGMREYSSSHF